MDPSTRPFGSPRIVMSRSPVRWRAVACDLRRRCTRPRVRHARIAHPTSSSPRSTSLRAWSHGRERQDAGLLRAPAPRRDPRLCDSVW